jgi:putative toxin-antitoxin system antitoxin component (TIGR02293 family)
MIADALGGLPVLGRSLRQPEELAQAVREGLPADVVTALGQRLQLNQRELSRMLGIPARTLSRRKASAALLSAQESDRTVRVARVAAAAVTFLGDWERATGWLHAPNRALGGARPLDLLDTDPGAQMVEDVLGRIAYGVYS